MSAESVTHPVRPWYMFGREKAHWGEGRIVVIQPDVLGKWFNPETSIIVRSEAERKLVQVAFKDVMAEMKASGKPSWYEGDVVDDGPQGDFESDQIDASDGQSQSAEA